MNKENEIDKIINNLLDEQKPDYSGIRDDEELIKMAELVLLMKKENLSADIKFEKKLESLLKSKIKEGRRKSTNLHTGLAFKAISFAAALLMFFIIPKPVYNVYAPMKFSDANMNKREIVNEDAVRLNNKRIVILLYNKKNNAILYWPNGQFGIFQ